VSTRNDPNNGAKLGRAEAGKKTCVATYGVGGMQEVLSVRLAQGVRLELLAAVGERQEQSALHWVWVCVTCRWV